MVTHKAWEKNLLIKYLCPRDFRRGEMEEKMKVLYWEGDGFVLLYKRLENGKFVWPRNKDEVMKITDQQFRWLLEGLKIEQPRTIKKSNKRCAI